MKKYFFNEDYFEDINTECKAYWLGFLYADGYIQKDDIKYQYRITLRLQKHDISHIQKFAKCLNSNHPIKEIHSFLNGKEYIGSQISLYSKKMVNDLYRLGCVQAKSMILKPPVLRNDLIRHFIRGYFDGDGSVYAKKDSLKRCSYSFLGTDDILNYIVNNAKISHYQIRNAKKNTECKELRISSIQEFFNLYHFMYDDSNIFLERKYTKSKNIINYCENNSLEKRTKDKMVLICDLWNNGMSVKNISLKTRYSESNIIKFLKEGAKKGICDYDAQTEKEKNQENIVQYQKLAVKKTSKEVFMYDSNYNLIDMYSSVSELSRKSIDNFGEKLNVTSISRVCLGQRKQYKGYIFSYVPLDNQENQSTDSLLLCSNE